MTESSIQMCLPPESQAAHEAREALVDMPVVPEDCLADVQLMVTELVTNSVRHAGLLPGQAIEVVIARSDEGLRVEVADHGPGFDPPPAPADPLALSGRGLPLVERLSDRWGVTCGHRTRVWFEIDLV
jgi:anti-sigma regulatory factor (Ser/Thr protein kinase)